MRPRFRAWASDADRGAREGFAVLAGGDRDRHDRDHCGGGGVDLDRDLRGVSWAALKISPLVFCVTCGACGLPFLTIVHLVCTIVHTISSILQTLLLHCGKSVSFTK